MAIARALTNDPEIIKIVSYVKPGLGLNGTTITLGMQNVFDSDPPFAGFAFGNGYDASLADIKGRFWYVQLTKRF